MLRTTKQNSLKHLFQKKQSYSQLLTEKALGDGNCAFNAFALGLINPVVIRRIEQNLNYDGLDANIVFKEFIDRVAAKLHIPANWQSVKTSLLAMRTNDPIRLQQTLAPILRHLSVSRILPSDTSEQQLLSSFADFVKLNLLGVREGVADDIYSGHLFIQRKFSELIDQELKNHVSKFDLAKCKALKQKRILTEEENNELEAFEKAIEKATEIVQKNLSAWWKTSQGFARFQSEMDNQPQHNQDAGDMELASLAAFWRVNLVVWMRGIPVQLHLNHGSFPRLALTSQELQELINRGIVNPPSQNDREIKFLHIDEEELKVRISAFPATAEEVQQILTQCIKGVEVPVDWSPVWLQQLYERGIVQLNQRGALVFALERDAALLRMTQVPQPEKIIGLWQTQNRLNPVITLENNGGHWDNKAIQEAAVVTQVTSPAQAGNDETERVNLFAKAKQDADNLKSQLKNNYDQAMKNGAQQGKYVLYFFDKEAPIYVKKEEQIKLDELYARKISRLKK